MKEVSYNDDKQKTEPSNEADERRRHSWPTYAEQLSPEHTNDAGK